MDEEGQKKRKERTSNFTIKEELCLIDLVAERLGRVETKTKDHVSWNEKRRTWSEITEQFNVKNSIHRSVQELKLKYSNLKRIVKKKVIEHRRAMILNTGSNNVIKTLSTAEKKMFSLMKMYDNNNSNSQNDSNSEMETLEIDETEDDKEDFDDSKDSLLSPDINDAKNSDHVYSCKNHQGFNHYPELTMDILQQGYIDKETTNAAYKKWNLNHLRKRIATHEKNQTCCRQVGRSVCLKQPNPLSHVFLFLESKKIKIIISLTDESPPLRIKEEPIVDMTFQKKYWSNEEPYLSLCETKKEWYQLQIENIKEEKLCRNLRWEREEEIQKYKLQILKLQLETETIRKETELLKREKERRKNVTEK